MADSVVTFTNNTGHIVGLPKHGRWNDGFRLIPGINRVPKDYIEAIEKYSSPVCDQYGKPVTRTVKKTVDVKVKDGKGAESIQKQEVEVEEPVLRFPKKATLDRLCTLVVPVVTSAGRRRATELTRHADGEIDASVPTGVAPPDFLPEKDKAALWLIRKTNDAEALKRWSIEDQRENVREAAAARLSQVS